MWAVLLVLALVCAVLALWWQLWDWAWGKVRPFIERWLWRRLGGEGDPPTKNTEAG